MSRHHKKNTPTKKKPTPTPINNTIIEIDFFGKESEQIRRYAASLLPDLSRFYLIHMGRDWTYRRHHMELGTPPRTTLDIPFEGKVIQLKHVVEDKIVAIMTRPVQFSRMWIEGESRELLCHFLKKSEIFCRHQKEDFVTCRTNQGSCWNTLSQLPLRSLQTLYFDPDCNISLLFQKDIQQFLEEENDYLQLGIPYKRNYCLWGPPGVGKTSLIFAIASTFHLDISYLHIESTDDSKILRAVSNIPEKSILVIEDIEQPERGRLSSSLSILLSLLDGVGHQHGLLIFLTTNQDPSQWPPALRRPGRIDLIQEMKHATQNQMVEMYRAFFPLHSESDANEFGRKVFNSYDFILPAAVMDFLFRYRKEEATEVLSHVSELSQFTHKTEHNIYV